MSGAARAPYQPAEHQENKWQVGDREANAAREAVAGLAMKDEERCQNQENEERRAPREIRHRGATRSLGPEIRPGEDERRDDQRADGTRYDPQAPREQWARQAERGIDGEVDEPAQERTSDGDHRDEYEHVAHAVEPEALAERAFQSPCDEQGYDNLLDRIHDRCDDALAGDEIGDESADREPDRIREPARGAGGGQNADRDTARQPNGGFLSESAAVVVRDPQSDDIGDSGNRRPQDDGCRSRCT